MQQRLSDMTVGEVGTALVRYKSPIATVVAIVLIALLLPGRGGDDQDTAESVAGFGTQGAGTQVEGAQGGPGPNSSASADQARTRGSFTGTSLSPQAGAAALAEQGADLGPFCDLSLGRLMVPSVYSPPCQPRVEAASNGGSTYQGVTKDTITIAVYDAEDNAAAVAIVNAAGADDSSEQVRATRQAYFDLFAHFYNTHGRKVKLVYVDGSGPADDREAAKADAIKVATEIKAFASLGSPNDTYVEELVARKVLCVCTGSLPVEHYLEWAPYAGYTSLMASTQGYVHRAEYIGKRLRRDKAKWAGDPVYQQTARAYGLIYFETETNAYKSGADFFQSELQTKYGIPLTDRVSYIFDLAQAQEQARTVIARLKSKGVTSVVFAGDFLYPIFFTQEATRQNYNPEWIITGSTLTDSTIFARTYDRAQWSHAFGVSFLFARAPQETGNAYRLHTWFFGRTPEADDGYGVIYPGPATMMLGIHMAGPNLTPHTFRDGLFAYPPSPQVGGKLGGGITNGMVSFGRHGLWPWDDYLALDDTTEIWWDAQATGKDEIGNDGVGMYRYVDGGKRYLPGEWPRTVPKAFDPAGTVLVYDKLPPQDQFKSYPCTGGCPSTK